MINILRLIGVIIIGLSIIFYGIKKESTGLKMMGIGIMMTSFKWSME